MVTLYNVKKFIEDGQFEHTQSIIEKGVPKPHNGEFFAWLYVLHGHHIAPFRWMGSDLALYVH